MVALFRRREIITRNGYIKITPPQIWKKAQNVSCDWFEFQIKTTLDNVKLTIIMKIIELNRIRVTFSRLLSLSPRGHMHKLVKIIRLISRGSIFHTEEFDEPNRIKSMQILNAFAAAMLLFQKV